MPNDTFPADDLYRALVHLLRANACHDWGRFAAQLAAAHVEIGEQPGDVLERAAQGDRDAVAFVLRCEVLTVASSMVELMRSAVGLGEFTTLDEAVLAARACFTPEALDLGAAHAALVGCGELAPEARDVSEAVTEEVAAAPLVEALGAALPETGGAQATVDAADRLISKAGAMREGLSSAEREVLAQREAAALDGAGPASAATQAPSVDSEVA